MRASCTFEVEAFTPVDWAPEVQTALPTGHAHMVKAFAGAVAGRSITQFSYAFDQAAEIGSYVATESFEGTVDGHAGTFNFIHSATTHGGQERRHELFLIVPSSGTGALTGISGTGSLRVDADGTHRVDFDYELPS